MPKRKGDFNAWRLEKLADPVNAANYLNAALEDSPEIFLDAIKDAIQARSVTRVAQEARVTRESLYRSFSVAGNPTFETLSSVLRALGLKISGVMPETAASPVTPSASGGARAHKRRTKYGRRSFTAARRFTLPFDRIVSANRARATLDEVRVGIVGLGTRSTALVGARAVQVGSGAPTHPKLQQRDWGLIAASRREQPFAGAMLEHVAQVTFTQAAR
jgi:probable addiction module antidote protein